MAVTTLKQFFDDKCRELDATDFNEYLTLSHGFSGLERNILQWTKEFALLHVQEALKRASEGAKAYIESEYIPGSGVQDGAVIDKQSILGAYGKEEIG